MPDNTSNVLVLPSVRLSARETVPLDAEMDSMPDELGAKVFPAVVMTQLPFMYV